MAMSHQCKVNGDFMHEIHSNKLDSHVDFKMLNGKENKADFLLFSDRMSTLDLCKQSEETFLFSCENKRKNDVK